MPEISAVIFDLGRVMVRLDTSGAKFAGLMAEIGVAPCDALTTFWDAPEVRQLMTGVITPSEFYAAVRGQYGISHDFPAFAEAWCDLFSPMPGMAEVFSKALRRYRVGILSDTDPLHWERLRELLPCLDEVKKPTLSYLVGEAKPHPALYLAAAANAGVTVEQCLFIDDLQKNVDGAEKTGMHAIRFTGAEALPEQLAIYGVQLD